MQVLYEIQNIIFVGCSLCSKTFKRTMRPCQKIINSPLEYAVAAGSNVLKLSS